MNNHISYKENQEIANGVLFVKDIDPYIKNNKKKKRILAKCKCGNNFEVLLYSVKSGRTKSCGCYRKKVTSKNMRKHGQRNTRLYKCWCDIKSRCYNENNKCSKWYKDKGIIVCDEWKDSFKNFYDWAMRNGYKENLTIDRINNNGNYEPTNCRWVDMSTQVSNTSLLRSTNTSGYRGINKKGNKWQSYIGFKGKKFYLGTFKTKEEAAKAYNDYVDKNNLPHTKNIIE